MQLVLLSGGSGKRLWPLSNDARSKQFLPLLENGEGKMESMVQRVVRQIKESNLTSEITIATNTTQLDIITNQLGDNVSVITEPERRDTFPAIALAACYLSYVKDCLNDEIVVVMPCDPYTEKEYFKAIGRIVHCVEYDVADLVLMGITPTYPSEKYGYVVAVDNSGNEVYKDVACFKEKPTKDVAEELFKQNAYWNAGVFAFRLGYVMNIVKKYVTYSSFEDVKNHYVQFPKISFDYEVVENAKSVAVVPFSGEWKDLGTWNTLTEAINVPIIGNAVMGINCENTHIINELHNPIYVEGLKDIVVAACPDGILVCGKEYTEGIKLAVENLTPRPMYEERRWGTYRVLDDTIYPDGHHALTKSITLNSGKSISYQIHHYRAETWTFTQGVGIFVLNGVEKCVKAGDTVHIPLEQYHAIKAVTELTFIEVQYGNPLIEEDIERFEYEWKNM